MATSTRRSPRILLMIAGQGFSSNNFLEELEDAQHYVVDEKSGLWVEPSVREASDMKLVKNQDFLQVVHWEVESFVGPFVHLYESVRARI